MGLSATARRGAIAFACVLAASCAARPAGLPPGPPPEYERPPEPAWDGGAWVPPRRAVPEAPGPSTAVRQRDAGARAVSPGGGLR
jgi:hypothetical protein